MRSLFNHIWSTAGRLISQLCLQFRNTCYSAGANIAGIFQNGLFYCGFDFSPPASQIWTVQTAGQLSTTTPYGFGKSWEIFFNPAIMSLGTNLTTCIVGFAFMVNALPGSGFYPVFAFYDTVAGASQCNLSVSPGGQLQFFLGSTTSTAIGPVSSSGLIVPNVWNYVEMTATISSTVGFLECRVNGATVVTMPASENTKATANTWLNGFWVNQDFGANNNTFIDDIYSLDMTSRTSYLGIVQCRGEAPNANSGVSGRNAWTPTNPTNVNFSNTANNPPSATEYNFSSTAGQFDMFRYPNFPTGTTAVYALQQWATLLLDSAGSRTVSLDCYSSGTDSLTTAFAPSLSAALYRQISTVDPNTSAAWTVTSAQAAELGVKLVS